MNMYKYAYILEPNAPVEIYAYILEPNAHV